MPPTEDNEYVLGTDDAELARLGFQHRLWSDEAVAHWKRAGFMPGMRVLDLGSGPGFTSRDIAQIVGPTGHVTAADISKRYLDFAERVQQGDLAQLAAPISTMLVDAHDIELEPNSFDACYSRWVLSFTPDPMRIVQRIAGALKPGAPFCVQDYSNWQAVFWGPRAETVPILRRAVLASYAKFGSDSTIASKLPGMMSACGLEPVEVMPLVKRAAPRDTLWHWPLTYFQTFLPRVVEMGDMSEEERGAIHAEWEANTADPSGFFITPPQLTITAIKR